MQNIKITAKEAKSFVDRLFGLINPNNPRVMFFETRFGIHTFFLKKPIDVLVLDDNYLVKKKKCSLTPWSMFFYPPKYKYVLELPKGYIDAKKIKLDDRINLCLI